MIIVDTNVISERLRETPNPNVVFWLDTQPADELYLCTPVLAELQYRVERLPDSTRRRKIVAAMSEIVGGVFEGRYLTFDVAAAIEYGSLVAAHESAGRPIAPMDAMIAAIALDHRAKIATRNVVDFALTGLKLINPFEATALNS